MGVVYQKPGSVLAADIDDAWEVSDITAHAEHAVDYHKTGLILAYPDESGIEVSGAIVVEADHLAVGQTAAVINAGVVGLIDNSDRSAADKRGDDTEIRLITRCEDQRRFFVNKAGDTTLQFFMHMGAAVEQARAGHRSAIFEKSARRRIDDVRVAGETEVVVGAEHEDALAVDLRLRAVIVVKRLKEGIYLALTRLVRERKLVGLGEDIAAVLAIVAVRQHGLDGHVWWQFGEGDRGRLAVLFASSSLGHICVSL